MSFETIWRIPEADVASGRIPGYVGAVRIGDVTEIRASGSVAYGAAAMRVDTRFRIASVTKPMGGALTLSLVEDGVLALDDDVARWLPELAEPRVLTSAHGPLDRTIPAVRPITVRQLLTCTAGMGCVLDPTPLQAAMFEQGVFPGPLPAAMSGDEFVARVAALPLAFQPGEGWLYDTPVNLLGVLLERATGMPLPDLFAARVFGPLAMRSTAFFASSGLATAYMPRDGRIEVLDPPDGVYSSPPPIFELTGGLVSTAEDVLRFFCAMADGGAPVISSESLALMTTDALDDVQRAQARQFVDAGSWGLATGVYEDGRWGWDGGTGCTARVDPGRGTVAVLLTQRAMTGPNDGFDAFHEAVASAARTSSGLVSRSSSVNLRSS
jgi:CubicO group peptidase (beta-lactamase class C family)